MDTGNNEHVQVCMGERVLDILHNLKAWGVMVRGKTLRTLTTKEVVGISIVIVITCVLYTIACNCHGSQNNQFTTATFHGETGWRVG